MKITDAMKRQRHFHFDPEGDGTRVFTVANPAEARKLVRFLFTDAEYKPESWECRSEDTCPFHQPNTTMSLTRHYPVRGQLSFPLEQRWFNTGTSTFERVRTASP